MVRSAGGGSPNRTRPPPPTHRHAHAGPDQTRGKTTPPPPLPALPLPSRGRRGWAHVPPTPERLARGSRRCQPPPPTPLISLMLSVLLTSCSVPFFRLGHPPLPPRRTAAAGGAPAACGGLSPFPSCYGGGCLCPRRRFNRGDRRISLPPALGFQSSSGFWRCLRPSPVTFASLCPRPAWRGASRSSDPRPPDRITGCLIKATERGKAMGSEARQDALCSIKNAIRCFIKTSWRYVSEYRALFSLVLLLYLLYKTSPGFFAFLVSTSPVIICTALLLGVLLSCGSAHRPEIHEDMSATEKNSAPEFGSSPRNVHIEAQQKRFPVAIFKDSIIGESSFGRRGCNNHADLDENVPLLNRSYQEDDRLEKIPTSVPSLKQKVAVEEGMKANADNESGDAFLSKYKGDGHAILFDDGKETDQGRVPTDAQSSEVADVSEHKAADGAAGKCKWGRAFSVRQRKKLTDIKIEAIDSAVDQLLDHPLCSPFAGADRHDDSSGFGHDNAEGHCPDVSLADTAPVLDKTETEMKPLLGAGCSCPDHITNDGSGNRSNISSLDSRPESGSNEAADSSNAKDDGEQNKDAGTEPAFLWTADDEEKNVMDLGYSETERNRRLEVLMVRRKSRKNIRFELDGTGCAADDLSRFRPQVQPIAISSARRTNPFADDADIPGSAPPVLHPRKNPFDFLLTEQSGDDSDHPAHHHSPEEPPEPAMRQDALFRRHESFSLGSRPPRFNSCFVLEELGGLEETGAGGVQLQRQFSDRSVSRLSAVSECDTVSSVGDQEQNELVRSYIRGVRESPSPLGQEHDGDAARPGTGSERSDDVGIGF
ncbi:hypothetical protein U9M48_044385 [Paspalum notatum var. saurae]|uniref:Uncharacterized protein n=1 Tax=Paspalum notatum var. saurae TaxID=547442 RepID=A0AAQ3XHG2_PASNO